MKARRTIRVTTTDDINDLEYRKTLDQAIAGQPRCINIVGRIEGAVLSLVTAVKRIFVRR